MHVKHPKLNRTQVGQHARRELTIIGPNCTVIQQTAEKWSHLLRDQYKCVFVDQDHDFFDPPFPIDVDQSCVAKSTHLTANHWHQQSERQGMNTQSLEHDLAFLNGNHFRSEKAILIYQKERHNKLLNKDLKNIICAISLTDEKTECMALVPENCHWIEAQDEAGLLKHILSICPIPSLNALILSGGKSSRMGQDKGALNYHGKPQREHLGELLSAHVECVYHSVRKEQNLTLENKIEDRFLGLGPFGAILSGMMHDPNAGWLVLACDLPNADEHLIDQLIQNRRPSAVATAYHNPQTDWPDPLCTIYEPKSYSTMLSFLGRGYSCPRKVLINSEIELLTLMDSSYLDNVNTPEEFKSARHG